MIHSVKANKPQFREVQFETGLNVILARRDKKSKNTDTCNGLGKTTLLHIIDFCLGADPDREDSLATSNLLGWEFTLEATIKENRVYIRRSVSLPDTVYVRRTDNQPLTWKSFDNEFVFDGEKPYKIDAWREFLGWALFGLEYDLRGPKAPPVYRPEGKELIQYFARKTFERENRPCNASIRQELSVTYLLGLNWEFLKKLDELKQRKKDADSIARSANLKMKEMDRKRAALEVECMMLEGELKRMKDRLDAFKINEQYEVDARLAEEYSAKIIELSNNIHVCENRIAAAKRAIEKGRADLGKIKEIYEEALFNFPEQVMKTLEEAQRFHEDVSNNRAEFLEKDIARLQAAVDKMSREREEFKTKKEEKVEILRTTGAIEQYTKMYEEYRKQAESLSRKQECLNDLSHADTQREDIKAKQKEAAVDARKVYKELDDIRLAAENCFADLAKLLYDVKGTLNIKLIDEAGRYGFACKPSIPYDRATGIRNIRIFAFDMMLFQQQRALGRGIDFLIHDSTIFDGADGRQIATALKEADARAREADGQYICMLNNGTIEDKDFKENFELTAESPYVRLELSDASPEKSLLGFRYH